MAEEELGKPQFDLGKPQFAYHATVEPIMIVGIMVIACYVNRRRDYAIFPRTTKTDQGLLGNAEIDSLDGEDTSEDSYDGHDSPRFYYANLLTAPTHAPKTRTCMGTIIQTPNSSRFANNWHSRFIQKFPFLVEMFYWAVNLLFYVCVKACSELIFATDGVWQTAQKHGIAVLYIEHGSFLRFLFPIEEVTVQSFFREGHQSMLTILNRAYSLIHIPVTVSFLAWYYYAAPTHAQFAAARRMMTVTNFTSFIVFTAYPCMPPRLLPEEFGFYDTVRREDAESIYATNKFFNQLAAFPSLHFGYSFCIGTVLMYHSGLFRRRLLPRERRMSKWQQLFFATLSIVYPLFVLTIIVATANHYYLDALAATAVVLFAWVFNRCLLVLLPLEDIFLYCIKLEKPTPTTGSSLYRW